MTLRTQLRRPKALLAAVVAAAIGLLSLPLIPSPAHAATATFKQVNEKEITSGSVNSVPFKSATTTGNLIVVFAAWTNADDVKVTDSHGNTYTSVEKDLTTWGSSNSSRVFYTVDSAGGANTVKATFATAIKSPGWADVYIHEYSGVVKQNPLDGSAVGKDMTTDMSSGSVTTTNDLIFGAGASSGTVTQEGNGFTPRSTKFGNLTEDMNVTAEGQHDATAKQSDKNNFWVMHVVAFKLDPNAPDKTAPTTPTGVTQTPTATDQIDLTWNPSTDNVAVKSYEVFRDGTPIAAPEGPLYTDTGLKPLNTYKYTVRARDAAGNTSAMSTPVSATTLGPAPDTTPPIVSLTAPTDGATVTGTIDVTATASDNVGVVGVQFQVDGNNLGPEDTTAPYTVSWDTTNASTGGTGGTAGNGPRVLTARARDAANNFGPSAPVKVTVDGTAPTVNITSPTSNAQVRDIVNVTANAFDNVAVAEVQFQVDGVDREAPDATAPYELTWDSRSATPGEHTISARARDTAGNPTRSTPITVTVSNDLSRCGQTTGNAPKANILEPTPTTSVVAGDTVPVRGEGWDFDCGPLQDSAFSWRVEVVDDTRTIPLADINAVKSGGFTVPVSGAANIHDLGANIRYRVTLTVTNRQGLKAIQVVEIYPKKVRLTFNTAPPGLTLYVDNNPRTTPFTLETLVGFKLNVEARDQTNNGSSYSFVSWSDGGVKKRDIVVPASDQTYAATYKAAPPEAVSIAVKQQNSSTLKDPQETVSTEYKEAQTAGDTNMIVISWQSGKGAVARVSDTRGNTYTALGLDQREGKLSQQIWYASKINPADARKNTVKVEFDGKMPLVDVRISEYSGLAQDMPLDVQAPTSSGTSNMAEESVTTQTANTMVFVAGISVGNFGTANEEFTERRRTQPTLGGLAGSGLVLDQTVNTIGTYKVTIPLNGSSAWLLQMVAFKAAS
jgi:hypothetical protein